MRILIEKLVSLIIKFKKYSQELDELLVQNREIVKELNELGEFHV